MTSDYLVVGAGAMGMAFTDVLLSETDATVTIVDRRGRPGGHWNDSYPFVRLHQPSAFYGVNSRSLGDDTIDAVGWNQGLYELASGTEVVTYFDQVMNQRFLPSGRVRYLPMSNHLGDGRIQSIVSDTVTEVASTKTVDASYMNVTVPSMRPPPYDVADDVECVPLNDLPKRSRPPGGYVVVGAGKTAMDACLWLLAQGADPDDVVWVRPRDQWLLDRANIQPGEFWPRMLNAAVRQQEIVAESTTMADMFLGLEAESLLLRVDPAVTPTMFRCATVTTAEVEQLRRIENVLRLGHVQRVADGEMTLDDGTVATRPGALFVDCTADGLERRDVRPIFDGDRLTLQTVRHCQQVFSAAFIGHVEAAYGEESQKNELCTVIPHPDSDLDWCRVSVANTMNGARWRQDGELTEWLSGCRLDGFSRTRTTSDSPAEAEMMRRMMEAAPVAITKLSEYVAQADSP